MSNIPIFITSNNVTTNNSVYTYNFPSTLTFTEKDTISVGNINIPYSWRNFVTNTTFIVNWPTTTTTSPVTLTIPAGYYTVPQMENLFQQLSIANGLYLISGSGATAANVYYFSVQTSPTLYGIELDFSPVPNQTLQTSLSLTQPSNWIGNATNSNVTPSITISNNLLSPYLGFTPGTYPSNTTSTVTVAVTSTNVPEVTPINAIVMGCSLCNSPYTNPTSAMISFGTQGVGYGNLIQLVLPYPNLIPIQPGSYNSITISFYDQNFNFLPILDTAIEVTLNIRKG